MIIRKWLTVGIILLFVGTCFIPAIAQDTKKPLPTSRGNWLYVGGSGPGNYTSIQDAIDNASEGDSILVYNGTYFEHINLDKTVSLIGENKQTTIIDGRQNGTGILISANTITITGFTIQNNEFSVHHGPIIGSTNYSVIAGNIIINDIHLGNSYGIDFTNSNYNRIENNTISNCYYCGIQILYNSSNNKVINNTITVSFWGGIKFGYNSNNNTIMRNNISRVGVSISLTESDYNQICYNYLTNTPYSGVVGLLNSSQNVITHNNFISSRIWSPRSFFIGDKNNYWDGNYWCRPILFVKAIFGYKDQYSIIPTLIAFDWHPAKEPYDISGTS